MFRKPATQTTPFNLRHSNDAVGNRSRDVGLRVDSTDRFLHAATRFRNLLQWRNTSSTSMMYCGISLYSFNTTGNGIEGVSARVQTGLAFMVRNIDTYAPLMYVTHDGRVAITNLEGTSVTSTAALYVNGNVGCSGSLLFNVATSQLSGVATVSQIPSLDASKVTSGTFHVDRIPTLAPSQFGSGVLTSTQMPNLAASKFTAGTLDAARIPDFDVSHFSATTLASSRIPNLTANKFTTGPFPSMFSQSTVMTPADIGGTSRWRVGMSLFATGVQADTIALNTWSDTSGGQANIVCLSKSSIAMRIYQGAQGSSATPSFRDVLFLDSPAGNVKVTCTDNSANAFAVTVAGADGGWTQFRIRGSSLWGDGVTTYNASNIYTHGVLYATVENVMLYNPHIPSNNGGTAGIRFGRAGGVATGTWWEIGVQTNGTYHIAREAGASKITISTAGAMTLTGDVTAFSDARKKTDVTTIEGALEKVCRMRGVFYRRKDEEGGGMRKRRVGVIAQEVAPIVPEVVHIDRHGEEDMMAVAYSNMVGVLIEAVKEAWREREELEELIALHREGRIRK